jgi:hypothetical protein
VRATISSARLWWAWPFSPSHTRLLFFLDMYEQIVFLSSDEQNADPINHEPSPSDAHSHRALSLCPKHPNNILTKCAQVAVKCSPNDNSRPFSQAQSYLFCC